MHIRLLATLAIPALLGLTPATTFAAGCGVYPLSPEQQQHINENSLAITIPEGDVPVVQRCDTNEDGWVDLNDIRAISLKRNQPAAHPDDPMDWDKNSMITLLDARGCQQVCSLPRCAVSTAPPPPSAPPAGVVEDASCFQQADFDGDGSQDFVGIFEHTGEEQAGGYNLKLVLVNEDASGSTQQVTVKYAGEMVVEDGLPVMKLHVSEQPPGEVDLSPGNITLENPGIVTYGYGKPEVIYYWVDGELRRGFYNIDD